MVASDLPWRSATVDKLLPEEAVYLRTESNPVI